MPSTSPRRAAGRLALALAAAGGVALGACSSSSSGTGSSTTTSAPAAGATTAAGSATTGAGDAALARRELLPASAFPSGWKGQGSGSANTQANFYGGLSRSDLAQVTGCLGVSESGIDTSPAEATDQEYDDPGSNVTVAESVEVYPTEAQAVTDVTGAANPKTPQCLVALAGSKLQQSLPPGATAGQVGAQEATAPPYGTHHAEVVMTVPFTYQGVSATLYIETVVAQQGRSEVVLQFTNTGGTAPATVVDSLTQAAVNKLSS